MIIIDKPKAIELLERAVAEKGEHYIYDRPLRDGMTQPCAYVRDGQPSCIVGHALFYVTEDINLLTQMDGYGTFDPLMPGRIKHLWHKDVEITEEAQVIFEIAQSEQDRRIPWGQAVKDAKETYATVLAEREAIDYDEDMDDA